MSEEQETGVVLIVDDNPANVQMLSHVLKYTGLKIFTAFDGETAINKSQQVSPDLIVLDVMMPKMDGFETCSQIKKNPKTKEIPVIFMTALTDIDNKVKGLNLGAADYLTKPFQPEEVIARVQVQVKLRQEIKRRIKVQLALENANQELECRLEQLTQTQSQLIQTEKMSNLGQMVAGIAHEIKNPLSCIYSNINPARDHIQDLVKLIEIYQDTYSSPAPVIQNFLEEIDLQFVVGDLENLMNSMELGTERIHQLILSLRIFSRLDTTKIKTENIHIGIDETLVILKHRLKAFGHRPAIEIIKEYGEIPRVLCYVNQLNQVFMNLLCNAIDALEESCEEIPSFTPKIWIHTQLIKGKSFQNYVRIQIRNNGKGIPQDIQGKLFEPFFTTKEAGKGTGLGLSISYQIIVEKHQGKLSAKSTPEQGTTFTIEIPVKRLG